MRYFRRPGWLAIALLVIGVPFFLRLGVWQLDRANEKDELLRRYAAAASAPSEVFGAIADHPPADRYPRTTVRGRFLADRYYLLDNQDHAGQQGVHVYAPFAVHDRDTLLLADLGFLPREGAALPHLPPLPTDDTSISGLYVPPHGIGMRMGGDALTGQHAWPKLSIYIDPREIGDDLGRPLYPRVLLLDVDAHTTYVRDWTPGFMPPARHRAYAFQWFTFALVAVIMFVVLHRKPRPRKRTENP